MDILTLVKLTSRAWSLPILAALHEGVPGRQAPLLLASGASRTAFTASLAHLIEVGVLERNPGHGHPLRPEFRLTSIGKNCAKIASKVTQIATGDREAALLRRSWTVPVLAVTQSPRRFSEIKSELPQITDRALSKSLDALVESDWTLREVDTIKRPPHSTYRAVNAGGLIGKAWGLTD